jgi:hypothetical protein
MFTVKFNSDFLQIKLYLLPSVGLRVRADIGYKEGEIICTAEGCLDIKIFLVILKKCIMKKNL